MRLLVLLLGFIVGSAIVAAGVAGDRLGMVALGVLLAVPAGAALKPELSREPYDGAINTTRRCLRLVAKHLRRRGPAVLVGVMGGLVVRGLLLGRWDPALSFECGGLSYPHLPWCDLLLTVRAWSGRGLILVGSLLGWFSHARSDRVVKTRLRTVFDVFGQLIAIGAVILGGAALVRVVFDLANWRGSWPLLAVGLMAVAGGLLYLSGFRDWTGRRAVASRGLGWLLFTILLIFPLLLAARLSPGSVEGVLLAAIALPSIPAWGRSRSPHPQELPIPSQSV